MKFAVYGTTQQGSKGSSAAFGGPNGASTPNLLTPPLYRAGYIHVVFSLLSRLPTRRAWIPALALLLICTSSALAVSGKPPQAIRSSNCCRDSGPLTPQVKRVPIEPNASAHRKLVLDAPVQVKEPGGDSLKTIKSLANGDSLINPWVPGRGAIGVKVQVAW